MNGAALIISYISIFFGDISDNWDCLAE